MTHDSTLDRAGKPDTTADREIDSVLADLLPHAVRFVFGREGTPGGSHFGPRLSVAETRAGDWHIGDAGMVFNHITGDWDTEYEARHSEGEARRAYHTNRDTAVRRAMELIAQWHAVAAEAAAIRLKESSAQDSIGQHDGPVGPSTSTS